MASNIVQIAINAVTSDFEKKMQKAAGASGVFASALKKIGLEADSSLTKAAVKGLSIGAIYLSFKRSAAAANEYWSEIDRMATSMGVTTKEAATLKSALGEIGITTEQYEQALSRISSDAATGGKKLAELGISVKNNDGTLKDSRDLLLETTQALAEMPPGLDKTAAGTYVLGESFAKNVDILKLNNDLLAGAATRVDELGLASEAGRNNAEEYSRSMQRWSESSNAVAVNVGNAFLPALTDLGNSIAKLARDNMPALSKAANLLAGSFKFVVASIQTLWIWMVDGIIDSIGPLGSALAAIPKLFKGDFAGVADTMSGVWDDLQKKGAERAEKVKTVWKDYVDFVVAQEDRLKSLDQVAPTTTGVTEAGRKRAAAFRAAAEKRGAAKPEKEFDISSIMRQLADAVAPRSARSEQEFGGAKLGYGSSATSMVGASSISLAMAESSKTLIAGLDSGTARFVNDIHTTLSGVVGPEMSASLISAGKTLAPYLSSAVAAVGSALSTLGGMITDMLGSVSGAIAGKTTEVAAEAIADTTNFLASTMNSLMSGDILGAITGAITMAGVETEAFQGAVYAISGLFAELVEAITPFMESLSPLVVILGSIVSVIINALSPVLEALGPALDGLFYAVKYLGLGIGWTVYGIEWAWNKIIEGVQWLLDALGLDDLAKSVGGAKLDIQKLEKSLKELGDMTLEKAKEVRLPPPEPEVVLPAAQEEPAVTPIEDLADAAGKASESIEQLSESVTNIPTGFKVEAARYNAMAAQQFGSAQGATTTQPIMIEQVQVVANDPDEMRRQLEYIAERSGMQQIGSAISNIFNQFSYVGQRSR